ncbi:MAG: hypothetical protein ACK5JT_15900, partial [Hyphomicrobiaceae bacterium]
MIGETRDGWKWAQASGLSVALHAAVLGYLIWQPSFDFLAVEPPTPLARIEIMPLTPAPVPETPQVTTETPASPDTAPRQSTPSETITSSVIPELAPNTAAPPPGTGGEVPGSGAEPETAPDPLPIQATAEAEAPDPRMLDLIERIRGRLTEPCMLALPMTRGGGELQLNVVSDSDRNITALMDDLTSGIDGEVAREAVLLDSRQCPAVAFVRRDQRYPVYPLGIQLETQQLARGASLRGQITNASGYYQSLLLIDENGAVHDMRRFLLSSSQATRFDFAVARYRQPRDTHQMLVALATPDRPETVTLHNGETAEAFFDALFAEVGQN